jgi:hypothetical protein
MFIEKLRFEVDGTDFPPTSMLFITQDVPFPGGHKFAIQITDCDLSPSIIAKVKSALKPLSNRASTQRIFDLLHSEMAFVKGYGMESRWVLNTVDAVTEFEKSIVIEGRCSPVKERRG